MATNRRVGRGMNGTPCMFLSELVEAQQGVDEIGERQQDLNKSFVLHYGKTHIHAHENLDICCVLAVLGRFDCSCCLARPCGPRPI